MYDRVTNRRRSMCYNTKEIAAARARVDGCQVHDPGGRVQESIFSGVLACPMEACRVRALTGNGHCPTCWGLGSSGLLLGLNQCVFMQDKCSPEWPRERK